MKRFCITLAALSFALLTAGCGQSGPLYLPGDPSRIESIPPAPTATEEEEETQEDAGSPSD